LHKALQTIAVPTRQKLTDQIGSAGGGLDGAHGPRKMATMKRQAANDRRMRLDAGLCPIHGLPISQIGRGTCEAHIGGRFDGDFPSLCECPYPECPLVFLGLLGDQFIDVELPPPFQYLLQGDVDTERGVCQMGALEDLARAIILPRYDFPAEAITQSAVAGAYATAAERVLRIKRAAEGIAAYQCWSPYGDFLEI
jgi:hypothetical protein